MRDLDVRIRLAEVTRKVGVSIILCDIPNGQLQIDPAEIIPSR